MNSDCSVDSYKRRNDEEFFRQGSFRRIISSDSVRDQQISSLRSASDKISNSISMEAQQLYSLFQQEYIIMTEYKMLQSENLHGVYVIPSFESSFTWYGVIFVRCGYYEGGVFRFVLLLPDVFPDGQPEIIFKSSVYHPAINPDTGNLNINEVFLKWDKGANHIWQLLKYVHWIFHNINIKCPANLEAAELYKTSRKVFIEKAKDSVVTSINHLYDDPPTNDKHYIAFSPYDTSVHDTVKSIMLKPSNLSLSHGLSWVQPGSFQPFSKVEESNQ